MFVLALIKSTAAMIKKHSEDNYSQASLYGFDFSTLGGHEEIFIKLVFYMLVRGALKSVHVTSDAR